VDLRGAAPPRAPGGRGAPGPEPRGDGAGLAQRLVPHRRCVRRDEDGNCWFVDRAKDAIRRRGENISSFEVELVVSAPPDVQERAAIPVRADVSEDELLVVVAPRYIRITDELPKTPAAKVQKGELRREGLTRDTWDREAASVSIRAERLI
jgi:carnitine-CoA ligase